MTLLEKVISKTIPEPNSGCWLWWPKAQAPQGYGHIKISNRVHLAHKLVYELSRGPVPEGLELTHKCKTAACCNPDHLELVSHKQALKRGRVGRNWAVKTHCPAGHPYDEENTILFYRNGCGPWRRCRACRRARKGVRSPDIVVSKRNRIYDLHAAGMTFREIARLVGLTECHCAHHYTKALAERGLLGPVATRGRTAGRARADKITGALAAGTGLL